MAESGRPTTTLASRTPTAATKPSSNGSLRDERSLIALRRWGFAKVLRAVDLLAAVGHDDIGPLGQIDIRGVPFQLTSGHRQLHALLDHLRCPPELLDQLLRLAELRVPAHCLAVLHHVENDVRVRI